MSLVIFDLDYTLLNGDSDHSWGSFLVKKQLVNEQEYNAANDHFFEMYKQGKLDIYEYAAFSFQPLAAHTMEQLNVLHEEFMRTVILGMIGEKAKALVQKHKDNGDTLIVITATNSFITGPIVNYFGIPNILATEPKIVAGRYVAEIEGIPCFQEGKVTRLHQWLNEQDLTLDDSYFYTDSHNDLPLMEIVSHPIAVNPDDKLLAIAQDRNWEIIDIH